MNAGQELYANRTPVSRPPDKRFRKTRKESKGHDALCKLTKGLAQVYHVVTAWHKSGSLRKSRLLNSEVGVQSRSLCKEHQSKSVGRTHGDETSRV